MSRLHSGRFELIRKLGEGSIGIVYEAHDHEQDMRVALKLLRRLVPAGVYRLKQEFGALRRLSHPNIVTLHDLVAEGDQWFMTMELIEGDDFVAYVRKDGTAPEAVPEVIPDSVQASREGEPPAFADVVDESRLRHVLVQVAQALHAMHLAGLVHQDLKPSNVRVTDLGRAVLMDFSIVAEAQTQYDTTSGSFMLGTPYYMAPEQAAGDASSAAMDWYALGVMTFQAITGRLPFEGYWDQVIIDKQERDAPRPGELVSGIPGDLEALCVDMLARRAHDRPGGGAVLERLGVAAKDTAGVLHGASESVFVGREHELGLLGQAFRDACGGQHVCVLVRGASGVGKSKLLDQFLRQRGEAADEPAIVLRGRCHPHDRRCYNAFDDLMDALSRSLLELPHDRVAALLPDDAELLPWMFPAFLRVPGVDCAPRTLSASPRELRRRAAGALRVLLGNLAAWRTVVLCVDDLQFADGDSLALLRDLLRAPGPARVLALLALDTDCGAAHPQGEPDALRLARGLERLARDARCMDLGDLPRDSQRQLVDQLLGGRAAALAECPLMRSGGSPLFLSELVQSSIEIRDSADAAPAGLDEAFGRRIARLPDAGRGLLEVIALAVQAVPLSLLARATDQRMGQLERTSATLRAARLVRVARPGREPWLMLYHYKVRAVVEASLSAERRREIHQQLALAFQRASDTSSDVLAHHWRGAGDVDKACLYLHSAARAASDRLAFERAAELYRMAGELTAPGTPPAKGLERSLADALSLAGRHQEAVLAYDRAARGAGEELTLELRCQAAEHEVRGGDLRAGVQRLATLAAELGVSLAPGLDDARAPSLLKRVRVSLRGHRYRARGESDIAACDLARMDALYTITLCLGMIQHRAAASVQAEHLQTALRHGEPGRVDRALVCDIPYLAIRGGRHLARAEAAARQILSQAERPGHEDLAGHAHLGCGVVALAGGRLAAAADHFDRAQRALAGRARHAHWELLAARYLGCVARLDQGRVAGAAADIACAVDEALDSGDLVAATLFACRPSTWRLLCLDRAEEALALVEQCAARWPADLPAEPGYLVERARAMAYLYCGDSARAAAAITACIERLRERGLAAAPALAADVHALAARIALVRGDEVGVAAALHALQRMEGARAAGHVALIGGALAHRQGHDGRAAHLLHAAVERFHEAGATHFGMSAKFRLSQVLGLERGAALMADAATWCEQEDIANVQRMFDYLVPWIDMSTVAGRPSAGRRD